MYALPFLVKFGTMVIQPNSTPQAITTRCRPHEGQTVYLLLAWFESEKVYPFISYLDYSDGHLSGDIAVPVVGIKNGTRLTVVIYPILESEAVLEVIETLRDAAPYYAESKTVNDLVSDLKADSDLLPEVYRGNIFVQTQTNQPYSIT